MNPEPASPRLALVHEQVPPPSAPAVTATSRGHVLLVDDELAVLRAWQRPLRSAGFTVDVLAEASALDSALAADLDAVVSDVRMPGLDGLEVLRRVRARHPDVPVLLATGDGDLESAMRAVEGGAFRYLLKPVGIDVLRDAVGDAVRAHRLERDRLAAFRASVEARERRTALAAAFERAAAKRWMTYQPIFAARGGALVAYEALTRTAEPGLIRPGDFFDAARTLDRVHDVGRAIRADVAAAVPLLRDSISVLVNLDPLDLEDPELHAPDAPLTAMARRVVLEITERASLSHVDDLARRVDALRERGFRIAVDDLGAGYAALSSVAMLRPDILKIDMSLVRGVDGDPVRRKLVQSIVSMAHDLGSIVVAEGIETPGERDAVVACGVDLLQGFLLGRPSRSLVPGSAAAAGDGAPRL